MKVPTTLFVSLLALWGASPWLGAADWPQWRGINRDGKSAETGLLNDWPQNGPAQLWQCGQLGSGYSNVAVVQNVAFTTGHKNKRLHLMAISAEGRPLWSQDVGAGFTGSYPGSRATPTFDGGKLYLESGVGRVGCYDANGGQKIWTRELKEFGGGVPGWGYAESVLIVGQLAIVTPGGGACIVALDKSTGATVWQSAKFSGAHYSSPIYFEFEGAPTIVNGTGGGILAVRADNGQTLWSNKFSAGNTANVPTPAYADGHVFWANGYGKGGVCLRLSAAGGGVSAAEAWRTRDMDCHHGGYVIVDGHIYGNHGDGLACLELRTGKKMWEHRGVGKGSVLHADGKLFLFSENNGVFGFGPASPSGFRLAGQGRVAGSGKSWAHPVISNGRLYLRYHETLYCFDVSGQGAGGPAAAIPNLLPAVARFLQGFPAAGGVKRADAATSWESGQQQTVEMTTATYEFFVTGDKVVRGTRKQADGDVELYRAQ